MINRRKAVIIGAGFVGASAAYALMLKSIFSEIVLIDANKAKAEGEAMDISHGLPYAHPMDIHAGTYDECADAYVIIVTAGAAQKPGETRLDLIKKNLKYIKGLKMHPYCSRMRIDDKKVEPYLALAEELHLPILVHTAIDDYSSILHLETVAQRHPDLTFIAAHMELYTDHDCAIEVMKRNPNIYCDTAWVEMKDAARAIEEVGKERVLFGSDAPLDGETTLDEPIYQNYFSNSEGLDEESYALLMGGNAKRIFKI